MSSVSAPEVGIVIANHNNEAYVGTAIESVARQHTKNIKVVVVDDASDDGSDGAIEKVLRGLDDDRFRYLPLEQRRGQAGAIRAGVDLLSSPFISVLDSDDVWYENFVQEHLAAHLNSDFPVALTYCDSHVIDGQGQLLAGTAWWFDYDSAQRSPRAIDSARVPKIGPDSGSVDYDLQYPLILHSEWTPNWSSNSTASMMLRRSFLDLVLDPAQTNLPLYVDFFFSTLAALLTGTIAIPTALYAYRMHRKNKHSDGLVYGGAYNSSRKPWEPIRDEVFRQVLSVLEQKADSLQGAFGAHRHQAALSKIRSAVRGSSAERSSQSRLRLQQFLWNF
jgi:glycosyltransferase involved in cell wall biosynthesis